MTWSLISVPQILVTAPLSQAFQGFHETTDQCPRQRCRFEKILQEKYLQSCTSTLIEFYQYTASYNDLNLRLEPQSLVHGYVPTGSVLSEFKQSNCRYDVSSLI